MKPQDISIQDYSYFLPEEKIATFPLPERDASRLLICRPGQPLQESSYRSIADQLPADSLLLFNNTRVVEARLMFQKPTGGRIEIFCLEPGPGYADITTALQQQGSVIWNCLIGGASKWKHGQVLEKELKGPRGIFSLRASWKEKLHDSFLIELSWSDPGLSFAELLHLAGQIPLPPYIRRAPEAGDAERYQTIFARPEGSVAAPTAGLHFTERIFESLGARNIQPLFLTLHVGAGTFKPVSAEKMSAHEMHAESMEISVDLLETLLENQQRPVTAVGTTSMRNLESLYWMGLKALLKQPASAEDLSVHQWDPYDQGQYPPATDALHALRQWMEERGLNRMETRTSLLIAPGYEFRLVQALVTNFHQPQSTLLLLVAAFIGERWRELYEHALKNDFRFLSYGDGCLLFRH